MRFENRKAIFVFKTKCYKYLTNYKKNNTILPSSLKFLTTELGEEMFVLSVKKLSGKVVVSGNATISVKETKDGKVYFCEEPFAIIDFDQTTGDPMILAQGVRQGPDVIDQAIGLLRQHGIKVNFEKPTEIARVYRHGIREGNRPWDILNWLVQIGCILHDVRLSPGFGVPRKFGDGQYTFDFCLDLAGGNSEEYGMLDLSDWGNVYLTPDGPFVWEGRNQRVGYNDSWDDNWERGMFVSTSALFHYQTEDDKFGANPRNEEERVIRYLHGFLLQPSYQDDSVQTESNEQDDRFETDGGEWKENEKVEGSYDESDDLPRFTPMGR